MRSPVTELLVGADAGGEHVEVNLRKVGFLRSGDFFFSYEAREVGDVRTILNMSFGMVGINAAVVIRRFDL